MTYLLDTNTVTRIVRKDSEKLKKKLPGIPMASLAISVITEAEILFGLKKKPEATRLAQEVEQVLLRLMKMPWTSQTARAYSSVRKLSESRGLGISAMDLLIASHAMEEGRVLVTNDSALHRLSGIISVEDWI